MTTWPTNSTTAADPITFSHITYTCMAYTHRASCRAVFEDEVAGACDLQLEAGVVVRRPPDPAGSFVVMINQNSRHKLINWCIDEVAAGAPEGLLAQLENEIHAAAVSLIQHTYT